MTNNRTKILKSLNQPNKTPYTEQTKSKILGASVIHPRDAGKILESFLRKVKIDQFNNVNE